jgi:restriction system protein
VVTKRCCLQIDQHNTLMRQQLRDRLGSMSPADFEALVGRLLVALGFQNVQVTHYSGDGESTFGAPWSSVMSSVPIWLCRSSGGKAMQAPTVQQVRGSLGSHDQGLSSRRRFQRRCSRGSSIAEQDTDRAHERYAATLLVEHGIGVRRTAHELIDVIDQEEDE